MENENLINQNLALEYIRGKIAGVILDDRSEAILMAHYGLSRPRTLREIAKSWDISPERVRQIEMKALLKIQNAKK